MILPSETRPRVIAALRDARGQARQRTRRRSTATSRCESRAASLRKDTADARRAAARSAASWSPTGARSRCAIIRACRELGIESVAVYSDADATRCTSGWPTSAVRIGPAAAGESYLRVDRDRRGGASRPGAEAIHPGYGFLSENARLRRARVEDAGLVFVGPPPGDAGGARATSWPRARAAERRRAGRPGHLEPCLDGRRTPTRSRAAERVGFPVLVKAAAGGGGRGMRRVDDPGGAPGRGRSRASREAAAAFGDGAVYLERYIERRRATSRCSCSATRTARVVALGERDCSVQRRHQKLVEEAPAPGAHAGDPRGRCTTPRSRVAREVGYTTRRRPSSSSTADGDFHFLEMNARLQVEHGVTELRRGLDLVREQLRVAAGEPLAVAPEDVVARGCAIEVRINAEDPATPFMPVPRRRSRAGRRRPGRASGSTPASRRGASCPLRPDGRQGHGRGRRPAGGVARLRAGARRDPDRRPADRPGLPALAGRQSLALRPAIRHLAR